jgi:hypothetical protein
MIRSFSAEETPKRGPSSCLMPPTILFSMQFCKSLGCLAFFFSEQYPVLLAQHCGRRAILSADSMKLFSMPQVGKGRVNNAVVSSFQPAMLHRETRFPDGWYCKSLHVPAALILLHEAASSSSRRTWRSPLQIHDREQQRSSSAPLSLQVSGHLSQLP